MKKGSYKKKCEKRKYQLNFAYSYKISMGKKYSKDFGMHYCTTCKAAHLTNLKGDFYFERWCKSLYLRYLEREYKSSYGPLKGRIKLWVWVLKNG